MFAEGEDVRVIRAAEAAVREGICSPVLVGREEVVRSRLADMGIDGATVEVVDPRRSPELVSDHGARFAEMTNNPAKLDGLRQAGVAVAEHEPHWVASSDLSHGYLEAKRSKLGHLPAALASAAEKKAGRR